MDFSARGRGCLTAACEGLVFEHFQWLGGPRRLSVRAERDSVEHWGVPGLMVGYTSDRGWQHLLQAVGGSVQMSSHASYSGSAVLQEHGRWRPDWTPDRVCLWWYLDFEEHPQLVALSQRVTHALDISPLVDVIPKNWLHLSLREVGFVDEFAPEAVRERVAHARRALAACEPLTLKVGSVGTLPGAVVLWAELHPSVEELRSHLTGHSLAASGFGGRDQRPHISVAYVRRECESQAVMRLVPPTVPVMVQVSRVILAAVTRREGHYEWTVQGEIALGSSATVTA